MSNFWILDYNLAFQEATTITASSEDPAFPASNLENYIRGYVWRSEVGNGTFVITTANNKINFKESGGGLELTATISPGTYAAPDLASEIQTQLDAAGAASYSVSHSSSTGKWTISTDGAYLALLWDSGSDVASSIGGVLGFAASDLTDALTYTGANIAIHTEEWLTFDSTASEESNALAVFFDPQRSLPFTEEATFRYQANATDEWSAPAFDQVVTLDDVEKLITQFQETAIDYRFRRLKIVDPANPNLFVEIAKVVIAKATELSKGPDKGFSAPINDQSKVTENAFGHRYVDVYPLRRGYRFNWGILPDSDIQILEQLYQDLGSAVPFVIVVDPLETVFDANRFVLYCHFGKQLARGHINYRHFTSGFDLVEAM
jgi:hypothetical protein